ncbi:MAG TPA: enoyl-CoA hydratase [Acidimicrobiales bacterium]
MAQPVVRTEPRGHVMVVTMDRPERRNALDRAAVDELAAALDGCDAHVRCVVLTGAGGHFCAGADLSGVEDTSFATALRAVLDRLRLPRFATMAAVDGAALGAGTQLAVACDLRVATPGASFGIPAARLGLAIDAWSAERLALLAGQGAARAMLLAAEVLKGDDAFRLGLVQRLGDLSEALGWADEIAALAPLTLQAHKVALEAAATGPSPAAEVSAARDRAWSSDDLREGLAAFRERRRPVFHGR